MRWMNRFAFYDEDDAGDGGGADDPPKNPPVVTTSPDTVKDLVETFKKTMERVNVAPRAGESATRTDPEAERRERAERYDSLKKKVNDLAATGDAAGAMEAMLGHIREESSRNQRPVTEDPMYRAAVSLTRRVAKSENAEVFDKYASEIDEYVEKLPPERRIDPGSYEEAVRFVRAQHLDDIVKERVEAAIAEAARSREDDDEGFIEDTRSGYRPAPVSRSGRPAAKKDDAASVARRLTAEQRGVAKSMGMTPEEYAKALLSTGGREVAEGRINVPILAEESNARIEPGRF